MSDDTPPPESTGKSLTLSVAIPGLLELGKPVVEKGTQLMEHLLGSPVKVAGGMLADQIYFWRWKNRVRIAARAKEILERESIAERIVPPSFLLPVVEAAGDVEEPELQDLWARLIASGVASDDSQHPLFRETLLRMNAKDAQLLRELAGSPHGIVLAPGHFRSIQSQAAAARLLALGLLGPDLMVGHSPTPGASDFEVVDRLLRVTEYGWLFIRTVMPDLKRPKASS